MFNFFLIASCKKKEQIENNDNSNHEKKVVACVNDIYKELNGFLSF
ncbi:MAG: hypothetical protein ACI9SJ_002451 [Flavobacteriaceae bacterium]|jgi:hypothetical protein